MDNKIIAAVAAVKKSKFTFAFTGAGISVESGIPPFRGENGIWNKYDPKVLDIDFFYENPKESWRGIKEIFYSFFDKAHPNLAHIVLGNLEKKGDLKCVVTQNIDDLHQKGGSREVYEFHGNSQNIICTNCSDQKRVDEVSLDKIPVRCCLCGGLTKPDFVFFGESIPEKAYQSSLKAARLAEVVFIIGALGEVMPAASIPYEAKRNGALIIEINPEMSSFTNSITDIYIKGKAVEVMEVFWKEYLKRED